MSSLFFDMMDRLMPDLRAGDFDACEKAIVDKMESLPDSPFHIARHVSISNHSTDAAAHFDRFFERESARFTIAAAYTEMNGFDINPDRWYCDLFAYTSYGGHDDYDWISEWQSEYFDDYTITGLEDLQAVYASGALQEDEFSDASYMSSLLVVVKFQQFMDQVTQSMRNLTFPLLTTAHDFDFIAESRRDA